MIRMSKGLSCKKMKFKNSFIAYSRNASITKYDGAEGRAQLVECSFTVHETMGLIMAVHELGVVVCACTPKIWEVEARGPGAQCHS